MPTRPHHALPASLTGDNPAALPSPGRIWSGTSDRTGSALLRTYLLLTTFVLPLSFACQDDPSDAHTISDPQGCRSIHFIAETDSTTTNTTPTTDTTTTATDSATTTPEDPVCGNGILEHGEDCDIAVDETCPENCLHVCGDGFVHGDPAEQGEQCDDGNNGDDLDGCTDECTLRYTVFVTSKPYKGDLNRGPGEELPGLDLADLRCQTLADAAGWRDKGTFRAWLSDSTGSPSTRFETAPKDHDDPGFTGTFALPDGTEVALGWEGLTTVDDQGNVLLHAIDMDDEGSMPGLGVWSNTTLLGTQIAEDPEYHCLNWSSADMSEDGRQGSTTRLDNQWTNFGDSAYRCNNPNRLYCFQVTHP